MSDVAIAGYATSGFAGETDKSGNELVLETNMAALDNAGVTREDLDSVMFTGQDPYDGAAISDGQKVATAAAYNKPIMRLQSGGGAAIHQARAKIRAGKADVVTVVAADSVTADPTMLSWSSHEALYHRPFGMNNRQSYGFFTQNYLDGSDVTREDLAATAAKNYEAAAENPDAHRREGYSTEEVLDSDLVVGPLTELMLEPMSYGAAVIVLVSEAAAAELDDVSSYITGTGMATEKYWYREMESRLRQPTLRDAAAIAYDEAGIDAADIDAAEIATYAPSFELLSYEALGFCDEGDGPSLVADNTTAIDGSLPINTSGGPLATSPPNSGGVYRAIAACQQIQGDLGRQSADCVLLADNDMHLGEPARTDALVVLEGGPA
ncbi:thiolase family protein [Halococcus sediminicola]|uniref:thiolase family protein n=1 Tax=Halococcus sediminicola TaxID=1264579 RepID=UPI0006788C9B|nr:thiolase family protein [Halococcus sediminicola]